MFQHALHVFNKARWNIVANEGLLYSFLEWTCTLKDGQLGQNIVYICNKENKCEQQPKLHVDGKCIFKRQKSKFN
jgi:hypothetical protein